jgi:hypothetical protein
MLLPYLFDATLNFSSSPFGLELPSSGCVLTPPGYVRRPKPVAVFQAQSSQTSIQLPLPFRTFILPDRSAQSAARFEKLAFVSGPFSLRSPQASIIFINYPLTDHRSRFATVYQAFLHSQNLACSVVETLSLRSPRPLLSGLGSVFRNPSAFLLPARSPRLETDFSSPASSIPFREPPQRGQRSRPTSSSQL